ncbi:GntR family transcriptional regulator [Streptomyces sp. NPDC050287]|uniref:GntR family transcriptional regulator n=1 Tax=Streptomyces sp. NPDC050287 TaxID=3365608 RepID=UPI003795F7CC
MADDLLPRHAAQPRPSTVAAAAHPVGPVRPETLYQRRRQTPDRLNNSMRRAYDLLRSSLQSSPESLYLVESELTESLSASRNTVRAVLQLLAKDGLVTRSPKRGTRSAPVTTLRINQIAPVEAFGGERAVHTQLRALDHQVMGCPGLVRERLELVGDWTVLMMESLVLRQELVLGILVSYVALSPEQSRDVVVDEPDAILFLERHFGVRIRGTKSTTIGATAADAQSARLVGVEVGAPMLFLEDVLEDEHGQARALSQFRLRSDLIAFQTHAVRSA